MRISKAAAEKAAEYEKAENIYKRQNKQNNTAVQYTAA